MIWLDKILRQVGLLPHVAWFQCEKCHILFGSWNAPSANAVYTLFEHHLKTKHPHKGIK